MPNLLNVKPNWLNLVRSKWQVELQAYFCEKCRNLTIGGNHRCGPAMFTNDLPELLLAIKQVGFNRATKETAPPDVLDTCPAQGHINNNSSRVL